MGAENNQRFSVLSRVKKKSFKKIDTPHSMTKTLYLSSALEQHVQMLLTKKGKPAGPFFSGNVRIKHAM